MKGYLIVRKEDSADGKEYYEEVEILGKKEGFREFDMYLVKRLDGTLETYSPYVIYIEV